MEETRELLIDGIKNQMALLAVQNEKLLHTIIFMSNKELEELFINLGGCINKIEKL